MTEVPCMLSSFSARSSPPKSTNLSRLLELLAASALPFEAPARSEELVSACRSFQDTQLSGHSALTLCVSHSAWHGAQRVHVAPDNLTYGEGKNTLTLPAFLKALYFP